MPSNDENPVGGSETASITRHVQLVLEKIDQAVIRAGRLPESVRLVAATKSVALDRIQEAIRAGVSILGENRVQEALPKIEALGPKTGVSWHFIGHLQRRKVRSVVGVFDLIHSVDSVELALEVDRRATAIGIQQRILLEVNVGGESSKSGFAPAEMTDVVATVNDLEHLEVAGLMAIPPPTDKPETARLYFRQIRDLACNLKSRGLSRIRMDELSMGMSQDFEVAIEEGATLVRIGTAIFGRRAD
jgi:pyridoxal phosphate enzyme (YggS family)